jgi:hypothetical protein
MGLDGVQRRERRGWVERRLDGEHLIEVGRLREPAEWFRFLDLRGTNHSTLRDGGDRVARTIEIRASIAKIRSERHVRDLAHGAERRKPCHVCQFAELRRGLPFLPTRLRGGSSSPESFDLPV